MTNKEQNNLSKYIALILRHRPDVVCITLDEHGWANVSDLLNGINKTQIITMKMLEKIVEEDSKQRYSFNREKTLIRANQGHSVKVDVELKECMPPDILYHGTGVKYCSSINKQGLISKSRLYVHLSKILKQQQMLVVDMANRLFIRLEQKICIMTDINSFYLKMVYGLQKKYQSVI